jgi:hypothetical protein
MWRKITVAVAVATLAVVAVTARPGTPAAATVTPRPTLSPVPGVIWPNAGCATGGFDAIRADEQGRVILPATITLCSRWSPGLRFTMVEFRAARPALALASQLRPYAPEGPTPVSGALILNPAITSVVGICLMRGTADRVACVRLDTTPDYHTSATPIDVADPLVDRAAVFVNDLLDPLPPSDFCGTCVQFPN